MYVKECGRIGTVREPRSRALARTMSEVLLLTSCLTPPTTERRAAEQRSTGAAARAGMHDFGLRRPDKRALRDRWQGETGPGAITGTVEPR